MSTPANMVNLFDPIIPVPQGIYETTTAQQAPLGTRLRVGDRTFHYAQLSTSANVAAGKILCVAAPIASHQSGIVSMSATSAGAAVVSITLGTAMTVNQYAEGYVAKIGEGLLMKVKTHPVIATAATGSVTLYDSLPVAVTTGPCSFLANPFKGVKIDAATERPVGVAPCAVTTGEYFWLQTYGPAAVLHSGATPAGAALYIDATGGAIPAFGGGTTGPAASSVIIGKNIGLAATAAEADPVFLTILP